METLEKDRNNSLTKSKKYNTYDNYNCPRTLLDYEELRKVRTDMLSLNLNIVKVQHKEMQHYYDWSTWLEISNNNELSLTTVAKLKFQTY